jgi:hypothetical protein
VFDGDPRAGLAAVRAAVLGAVLFPACLAGGCTGEPVPTVERAAVVAGFVERLDISRPEAECVADEVYEHYRMSEIVVIHEEGVGGLQPARWSYYVHAVAACVLAEGVDA